MAKGPYVSDELTHFVGRELATQQEQFELLVRILCEGTLTHRPHAPNISGNIFVSTSAPLSSNERYLPQVICFCDIPLDVSALTIHMEKYGRFGLSFTKQWIVKQGANPVFYIAQTATVPNPFLYEFNETLFTGPQGGSKFLKELSQRPAQISRGDLFDRSAQSYTEDGFLGRNIFAFMKFYDPDLPADDRKNYYMEREWRVVGNLNFNVTDVAHLLLPQGFVEQLPPQLDLDQRKLIITG